MQWDRRSRKANSEPLGEATSEKRLPASLPFFLSESAAQILLKEHNRILCVPIRSTGDERPLRVIFNGFSGGHRPADVRFCPASAEPGQARNVAFGRALVIQTPKPGGSLLDPSFIFTISAERLMRTGRMAPKLCCPAGGRMESASLTSQLFMILLRRKLCFSPSSCGNSDPKQPILD